MNAKHLSTLAMLTLLAACSTTPPKKPAPKPRPGISLAGLQADGAGREVLMVTLGLLGNDYKFGGTNPEAGLDCSGMAGYIYRNALGVELPRTAAQIAEAGRSISMNQLRVGDFVFFNTMNRRYSHMGIFIGDGKFVHAPRTNSQIRVERLDNPWFMSRFDGARTLFN
ncbi:C40 family peptidase [Craterilacuibacter sp. RT1T]|uniref:C40 family peptidase n=1 Tax=Craterilacuibacter sp. RT1T TaxID=2942211 RepID=UPI0020BFBF35|nr:C40 family peptidase [Craterilacuibacter sp. RT1T]MCL6263109.1 C40 family peptidase [Craterilacuibacter sp. RT1T]